jgi:hypothetical protein
MNKIWTQPVWIAGLCLLVTSGSASDRHTNTKAAGIGEFSGTYFAHFGLGHSDLTLTNHGAFQLDQQGDIPVRGYTPYHGSFTFINRLIKLMPQGRRSQQELRFGAHEYYAVRWGKRRYLVAADRMLGFCNEINSGGNSLSNFGSWSEYYLHTGDDKLPVPTTPPDVPVKWKGYLLNKIIQGHVIRIINNKSAKIDVGSSDGLKPGMELIEEKSGEPFEVIACDMHSAKVRRFESPFPRPASQLKVGASVISRYKDEADR